MRLAEVFSRFPVRTGTPRRIFSLLQQFIPAIENKKVKVACCHLNRN